MNYEWSFIILDSQLSQQLSTAPPLRLKLKKRSFQTRGKCLKTLKKTLNISDFCPRCDMPINSDQNILCNCPNGAIASYHRSSGICSECRVIMRNKATCSLNRQCNSMRTKILKSFNRHLNQALLKFQSDKMEMIQTMFQD